MSQTIATLMGLAALVLIIATPLTLLWIVERSVQRTLAAVEGWAKRKGLHSSDASAAATVHPGVPTRSFARGRDLVSFSCGRRKQFRHFTIYVRPHGLQVPALGLQRKMWGGGGEPLGDQKLDEHYRLTHGGADAVELLCNPAVQEKLVRDHRKVFDIHVYEGVLIVRYQLLEDVDPPGWDRAWELVGCVMAACDPESDWGRRASRLDDWDDEAPSRA